MAIEALSQIPGAELEIISECPIRATWQQIAETLGIANRVFFSGFQDQKECARRLASAVALVLPSIYECGGAVVLEAMATGTPVIATKWGGPADYLDETSGILIDPTSRAAIIDGFAARDGIIYDHYEGVLAAPAMIDPVPFEIILETPHHSQMNLQIEALVVAMRTILSEYRRLISFAANI